MQWVFYGQETGVKKENPEKPFDELGVLLPIHEFEKKMLQHMEEIDGIVLACRERMMELAGKTAEIYKGTFRKEVGLCSQK